MLELRPPIGRLLAVGLQQGVPQVVGSWKTKKVYSCVQLFPILTDLDMGYLWSNNLFFLQISGEVIHFAHDGVFPNPPGLISSIDIDYRPCRLIKFKHFKVPFGGLFGSPDALENLFGFSQTWEAAPTLKLTLAIIYCTFHSGSP